MSSRLRQNLHVLQQLKAAKTERSRRKILRGTSRDFIICLIECIVNVLRQEIPLKPTHRKKLLKHAHVLRQLAKIRSEQQARKVICQKGGVAILPALLPVIIPAVITLIGELIRK
jgi:hypothetical protein